MVFGIRLSLVLDEKNYQIYQVVILTYRIGNRQCSVLSTVSPVLIYCFNNQKVFCFLDFFVCFFACLFVLLNLGNNIKLLIAHSHHREVRACLLGCQVEGWRLEG